MKPIKFKGVKPEDMDTDDWNKLDEQARSTIMLSLNKIVYYNVKETKTSYKLWQKLWGLFKKISAAS